MAITKNVTAADVVQTGGKAEYPTMVLSHYKDNGEVGKIGNFAAKLDEATRAKLKTVAKGTKVSIVIDKPEGSKYWNLVSVGDPVAETTTSGAKKTTGSTYSRATPQEGRLTDVERAEGMQRGNVLTNAVNLVIAAGITESSTGIADALKLIRKTATSLLEISNSLETSANNEIALATSQAQQAVDVDDPEVTESLGF